MTGQSEICTKHVRLPDKNDAAMPSNHRRSGCGRKLPGVELPRAFRDGLREPHTFAVTEAGVFTPPTVPGDVSALDASHLHDLLLYVEHRIKR